MKKKYTWIRQITRVLLTLMLTIAVSVPVMAEPKAVDVDTQLSNMYTVNIWHSVQRKHTGMRMRSVSFTPARVWNW